jgi:hypothetical protein
MSPDSSKNERLIGQPVLWGLLALIIAFGFLYCGAISPYWKITPDSSTYVLIAQSLSKGQGYREGAAPALLFPPGTSALLSAAWTFRNSYRDMNAEVVLFAFASMAICFLLFRDSLGTAGSLLVVLLCLGSVELFASTTFLLSDIFFLFFSLLAFWWYRRGSTGGTVLSVLCAIMVRTVGVCLAVAFLLDALRKRPVRWVNVAANAFPLVCAALWEVRNRSFGLAYSSGYLQAVPWVPSAGRIKPLALWGRFVDNLAYGRTLEAVMTNGWTEGTWTVLPGLLLTAVLVVGLLRLARGPQSWRGISIAGIYFLVYWVAVGLVPPPPMIRYLLPLLPFVFACLVAGLQDLVQRKYFRWTAAPAALFLSYYLLTGFLRDGTRIVDERHLPLPGQPIKYVDHYDVESLALWWKDHATQEGLACQHANVIRAITGRGEVVYATDQPGYVESEMRSQRARFLLLSLDSEWDRKTARMADQNARFHLVKQEGQARLYELEDLPEKQ